MPNSPTFQGFDHVDCRVRSLAKVEAFYNALMPELGLPVRRYSRVDDNGEWHRVSTGEPYNTIEFYEPPENAIGRPAFFIGFIERTDHMPGFTRIAFRVAKERMRELEGRLSGMGARNIERSEDMESYPAIFFEDPAGTKLELVARSAAGAS